MIIDLVVKTLIPFPTFFLISRWRTCCKSGHPSIGCQPPVLGFLKVLFNENVNFSWWRTCWRSGHLSTGCPFLSSLLFWDFQKSYLIKMLTLVDGGPAGKAGTFQRDARKKRRRTCWATPAWSGHYSHILDRFSGALALALAPDLVLGFFCSMAHMISNCRYGDCCLIIDHQYLGQMFRFLQLAILGIGNELSHLRKSLKINQNCRPHPPTARV